MKLFVIWKAEKELWRESVSASVRDVNISISSLHHSGNELLCASHKATPITLPHILESK